MREHTLDVAAHRIIGMVGIDENEIKRRFDLPRDLSQDPRRRASETAGIDC